MIFSEKQIIHAHFLITEHEMDAIQLAEKLGTSMATVQHLIKLVWEKYEPPKKERKQRVLKRCCDAKTNDLIKTSPAPLVRPKAEYSNKRLYDLI